MAASVFEAAPSVAVLSVFVSVAVVASVLVVPSLPVAIVAVPVVVVAAAVVAALSSGQPIRPIANIVTSARRIIIPFCALNVDLLYGILSKVFDLFKILFEAEVPQNLERLE